MDGERFTAFLNSSLHDWLTVPLAYRPWFYPPSFLVLLLPFAPLGFVGSYVAFQIVSAALLAAALLDRCRPARPRPLGDDRGAAVAGRGHHATDGQCAFLVAALLIAGFRALPHRPVLGGVLLGLLSFKPQFCRLDPDRADRRRAMAGTAGHGPLRNAACGGERVDLRPRHLDLVAAEADRKSGQRRSEMGDLRPHLGPQRLDLRQAARRR